MTKLAPEWVRTSDPVIRNPACYRWFVCLFVCWSLTSLCHSNGHIETMPAQEINPFTALTRIRSQFLRTQWSTSNHSEWTRLRLRPLSHRGWRMLPLGYGARRCAPRTNDLDNRHRLVEEIKLWCFRPLLCTLFRLNWANRLVEGLHRISAGVSSTHVPYGDDRESDENLYSLTTGLFVYWSLTSPFVTVMDISATDRNPEPGDNPLLFSTDSKGSFRCTQPQTVIHTTKPLLNQLGTTGICPHRSNQPTQDSNPGPSDHESQTLCVSPPSEDSSTTGICFPSRYNDGSRWSLWNWQKCIHTVFDFENLNQFSFDHSYFWF